MPQNFSAMEGEISDKDIKEFKGYAVEFVYDKVQTMRKHKFLPYIIVIFIFFLLLYLGIFFMIGDVTINVKDANSNKYITNVNINLDPNLEGLAGPGTDGAGPFRFELHIPAKTNLYIRAEGYKDKSLNLTLIPFKKYTIYLEPNHR